MRIAVWAPREILATPREVAAYFGVGVDRVYAYVAKGVAVRRGVHLAGGERASQRVRLEAVAWPIGMRFTREQVLAFERELARMARAAGDQETKGHGENEHGARPAAGRALKAGAKARTKLESVGLAGRLRDVPAGLVGTYPEHAGRGGHAGRSAAARRAAVAVGAGAAPAGGTHHSPA